MAKDIWELATKIRKEAQSLESALCDANGDASKIEDDIKYHIEELESFINEVKTEIIKPKK